MYKKKGIIIRIQQTDTQCKFEIFEMSQFLPPYLLALFAPRDPPPYLPPVDKLTHEKKRQPYTGLADYLDQFEVTIQSL